MTDVALEKMRPSSMARVIACPGSRRLAAIAGPRGSTSYADEGTAAHALLERSLRSGLAPFERYGDRIPVNGKDYIANKDMVRATSHFWLRVQQDLRAAGAGARLLIEQKVFIRDIDNSGTADVIIIAPALNKVFVHDYKHGKGVYVSEHMNAQFLCYGVGTIETVWPANPEGFDTSVTVDLVCHQPRFEGAIPVRCHTVGGGEIQRWRHGTLLPAIKASEQPDAPFKAGDHCMFCPAKDICATYLASPTKPHRGFTRQSFTVDAVPATERYAF